MLKASLKTWDAKNLVRIKKDRLGKKSALAQKRDGAGLLLLLHCLTATYYISESSSWTDVRPRILVFCPWCSGLAF